MGSLAGLMPEVDAAIFAEIGEVITFGTNEAAGIFNRGYREIEYPTGVMVGLGISFDTQWQSWMADLEEGDEVSVAGPKGDSEVDLGTYRFLRRIPPEGDESGLVIFELGSLAP